MQLKQLEQRHGIVLEAARRDWYGQHGPASSFFASGTILLKSWKGAAESDRTSALRCCCCLCTRTESPRVCLCVRAFCWQVWHTQGRLNRTIFEYVIFQGSSLAP